MFGTVPLTVFVAVPAVLDPVPVVFEVVPGAFGAVPAVFEVAFTTAEPTTDMPPVFLSVLTTQTRFVLLLLTTDRSAPDELSEDLPAPPACELPDEVVEVAGEPGPEGPCELPDDVADEPDEPDEPCEPPVAIEAA